MTIHAVSGPARALSRRTILRAGAAAGGGLLLGFYAPFADAAAANTSGAAPNGDGPFAPDAFIRIDRQGKVTLIMPQVEMGQGVYTSLAMVLAEELDVTLEQVTLEAAPPNEKLYANPVFGVQATGNSNSIRAFWLPMRNAAAGARALLVETAAGTWNVDPVSCRTDSVEVIHNASGRKLGYAALVDRAATLKPPQNPPLKAVKDFKLIG